MKQLEIDAGERAFEDLARRDNREYFLCDLHTHLLGTGSDNFWYKHVLLDHKILPPLVGNEV